MKLIDDIIRLIERFLIHFLVVVISFIAAHADEPNPLGISFYGSFLHTEKVPNALFFFSEIKDEDSFELRKALRDHDVEIMVLSSEGGSVFEGLQMSGIINDKGLSTYIPGESPFGEGNCASACSYMFFAGNTRLADGKLGVHQFASAKPDEKAEIGEIQSNAQFVVSEIAGFLGEYDVPAFVYSKMFQSTDMYYFKRSEMREIERSQKEISRKDLNKIEEFIEAFKAELKKIAEDDAEPKLSSDTLPKTTEEPSLQEISAILPELSGTWYFDASESSPASQRCTPLQARLDLVFWDRQPPSIQQNTSYPNRILYDPSGVSFARLQCREGGELLATQVHFGDEAQRGAFIASRDRFTIIGEIHFEGASAGLTKLSFSRERKFQSLARFVVDKRTNHQKSKWDLTYSGELSERELNCINQLSDITLHRSSTMLEAKGLPYLGIRRDAKGAFVRVRCSDGISITEDNISAFELSEFALTISVNVYNSNKNTTKKIELTFTHSDKFPLRPLLGRWYLKYEETHGCYTPHSYNFERDRLGIKSSSINVSRIKLTEQNAEGFLKCINGSTVKLMGAPSFKNEYSDFYTVASICTLARECKTQRVAFSRVKSNQPKLPKNKVEQTQSYSAPKLTKKEQIQKAQKRLNQLGCKAGFADGVIGKRTKRALQRFNQANNKNLSANKLHELSSINTLNVSSKRCYIPPLEGNWTLAVNNCQGQNIRAKATLEHRSGNKYDFYYENNLGDVATGVLEDKKNIARIRLDWTTGYTEIVNLNLSSSKRSVDGPWSNCWVTGRKN